VTLHRYGLVVDSWGGFKVAEPESLETRLARLAPEARARVEAALVEAVQRELVQQGAGLLTEAKEFSKGWFFSRSRPQAFAVEDRVIQEAASMDEASFAKFASRLRMLRDVAKETKEAGESGGK
jgi:hypothetical protein